MTEIGELIAMALPGPEDSSNSETEEQDQCLYQRETHVSDYNGSDSKFVSSEQIAARSVAFSLRISLWLGIVTVVSVFRWGSVESGITTAERSRTIRVFMAKVSGWGHKFRLKVIDPECGTKTMPIGFLLRWNPDNTTKSATHRVNLVRSMNRADVTGYNVNVGYNDVTDHSGWVLAHEYGHTVALADEYLYTPGTIPIMTYKKADGSTDRILLEPTGENIMRTHSSRNYLKRHYYFIAIEAQELLRQKTGRSVTCEIV